MAGRAGAQSKLNLHLGAPSGRSARRGHRSPLMASSKCGAAASAPRVSAPPPSPRALCKMVFTKVNIGRPHHPGPPAGSPRWPRRARGRIRAAQASSLLSQRTPPRGDACQPDPAGPHPGSPRALSLWTLQAAPTMERGSRRFGPGRLRVDSWLVCLYNLGRSLHLERSGLAFLNASPKGLVKGPH